LLLILELLNFYYKNFIIITMVEHEEEKTTKLIYGKKSKNEKHSTMETVIKLNVDLTH